MKKIFLTMLALATITMSAPAHALPMYISASQDVDGDLYFDAWDFSQSPEAYVPIAVIHNNNGMGQAMSFDFDGQYMSLNGTLMTSLLSEKEPTLASGNTSQFLRGDKTWVTPTLDAFSSGTNSVRFTSANQTKLNGIATGATANSSDATLLARANHTGVQAESTVTNLTTDLANRLTVYSNTTLRSNPVLITKSSTTSSGVATFYLTADNTSTGAALCPNGVETTATNLAVNDSTGMFTYSWAITNSNKTLTATVKALNLLALGLGNPANGTTVNLAVVCY